MRAKDLRWLDGELVTAEEAAVGPKRCNATTSFCSGPHCNKHVCVLVFESLTSLQQFHLFCEKDEMTGGV
jgi:hypothetical protein